MRCRLFAVFIADGDAAVRHLGYSLRGDAIAFLRARPSNVCKRPRREPIFRASTDTSFT
jgi:hypothetical protein